MITINDFDQEGAAFSPVVAGRTDDVNDAYDFDDAYDYLNDYKYCF